jgi:hypothetical protein
LSIKKKEFKPYFRPLVDKRQEYVDDVLETGLHLRLTKAMPMPGSFPVLIAKDGEQAFEIVFREQMDIVPRDIMMTKRMEITWQTP